MGDKVVAIHQPNFFPWLGFFSKIKQADIFVFLDNVQFIKKGGSYSNRVAVNIQGKEKWITAPIERKSGVWNINESHFVNNNWRNKLLNTLQSNYSKAPFYKIFSDAIFELINYKTDSLSEFNINAIKELCKLMKIEKEFILSSELEIEANSTQRLVNIALELESDTYLSGFGGNKYQEEKVFNEHGIKLIYSNFQNLPYQQLNSDSFIKGLSIIDALFNVGEDINELI